MVCLKVCVLACVNAVWSWNRRWKDCRFVEMNVVVHVYGVVLVFCVDVMYNYFCVPTVSSPQT